MTTPANWRLWGKLASSGPASLTRGRWRTGRTWWVDTVNGSDDNSGTSKEKPAKRLEAISFNMGKGDKIVLLPYANVVVPEAFTFAIGAPGIEIVGQGVGAAMARISRNVNYDADSYADSALISVTAPGAVLDNILFPAGRSESERIYIADTGLGATLLARDCVFELGADDPVTAMNVSGAKAFFRGEGSTFRVTSRDSARFNSGHPSNAITVYQGMAELENCTIDGGVYGWEDKTVTTPYSQVAVEVVSGVFRMRDTRLINHSDVYVHANDDDAIVDIETTDSAGEPLIGEDCSVIFDPCAAPHLLSHTTEVVEGELTPITMVFSVPVTGDAYLFYNTPSGSFNHDTDGTHSDTTWTWTPVSAWHASDGVPQLGFVAHATAGSTTCGVINVEWIPVILDSPCVTPTVVSETEQVFDGAKTPVVIVFSDPVVVSAFAVTHTAEIGPPVSVAGSVDPTLGGSSTTWTFTPTDNWSDFGGASPEFSVVVTADADLCSAQSPTWTMTLGFA